MGVAWFNYQPTRKMYIVVRSLAPESKAGFGKPTLEYLCWGPK